MLHCLEMLVQHWGEELHWGLEEQHCPRRRQEEAHRSLQDQALGQHILQGKGQDNGTQRTALAPAQPRLWEQGWRCSQLLPSPRDIPSEAEQRGMKEYGCRAHQIQLRVMSEALRYPLVAAHCCAELSASA